MALTKYKTEAIYHSVGQDTKHDSADQEEVAEPTDLLLTSKSRCASKG